MNYDSVNGIRYTVLHAESDTLRYMPDMTLKYQLYDLDIDRKNRHRNQLHFHGMHEKCTNVYQNCMENAQTFVG